MTTEARQALIDRIAAADRARWAQIKDSKRAKMIVIALSKTKERATR